MTYDNPIREALEAGEVVVGASTSARSPVHVDVYGHMGLDFVRLDLEHVGEASADAASLADVRRAATAAGIEPIVRIESGEPQVVRKALDAGIRNLIIPRVETAEEVRRAVEASRFDYEGGPGERGVAASLASDWGVLPEEYADAEDAAVSVGVMLENEAALENVEEILDVPELGFGWIGASDLSVSLGHPLELDHPEVREATERFVEAFTDAGVPVGVTTTSHPGGVEGAVEDGYRILNLGSETGAARQVFGEEAATVRDAAE